MEAKIPISEDFLAFKAVVQTKNARWERELETFGRGRLFILGLFVNSWQHIDEKQSLVASLCNLATITKWTQMFVAFSKKQVRAVSELTNFSSLAFNWNCKESKSDDDQEEPQGWRTWGPPQNPCVRFVYPSPGNVTPALLYLFHFRRWSKIQIQLTRGRSRVRLGAKTDTTHTLSSIKSLSQTKTAAQIQNPQVSVHKRAAKSVNLDIQNKIWTESKTLGRLLNFNSCLCSFCFQFGLKQTCEFDCRCCFSSRFTSTFPQKLIQNMNT